MSNSPTYYEAMSKNSISPFIIARRRFRFEFFLLLFLLTGCFEEVYITSSFKENGSGTFVFESVGATSYSEDSIEEISGIEDCNFASSDDEQESVLKWNSVNYFEPNTRNNPSSGGRCVYVYEFSSLEELAFVYEEVFEIRIRELSIDDSSFRHNIYQEQCESEPLIEKVNFTMEFPGEKISHNADRILGNSLTWNVEGISCYEIIAQYKIPETENSDNEVMSELDESAEILKQPSTTTELDETDIATEESGVDSALLLWTTIGASIATIFATIFAFIELVKKK